MLCENLVEIDGEVCRVEGERPFKSGVFLPAGTEALAGNKRTTANDQKGA